MHLLRDRLTRPLWWLEVGHLLEADLAATVVSGDVGPGLVVGGGRPAEQRTVEGGERRGVRTVEDDYR